jgi:hypothetical protein
VRVGRCLASWYLYDREGVHTEEEPLQAEPLKGGRLKSKALKAERLLAEPLEEAWQEGRRHTL